MPASHSHQHPSVRPASVRKLLLSLGAALVAGGSAVYDVEEEVRRVAWILGYQKAQVSASPTSVWVALHPGEAAAFQVVPPALRLDQSEVVSEIGSRLLAGETGVAHALSELGQVRALRPRFGAAGHYLGAVSVAVGIAMIMQPGLPNLAVVALMSLVVTFLARVSGPRRILATLLPTLAAFAVSTGVLLAFQAGLLEGPLRTIICPLAVLLPGAVLATGMAELAGGMMVSGTSRLVYGITLLLLFTLGVIAAAMVLRIPFSALGNVRVAGLGLWAAPVGLVAISLGIVVSESLPLRVMPWSLSILASTYVAQSFGQQLTNLPAIGTFVGALVASFGSSAIEATRPRVSRLVVFLPSFWLLVPGTLGVIGITQVGTHQAGFDELMGVGTIVVSIALGLLIGATLARPLYPLARRYRRNHKAAPDSGAPITVPPTADEAHPEA